MATPQYGHKSTPKTSKTCLNAWDGLPEHCLDLQLHQNSNLGRPAPPRGNANTTQNLSQEPPERVRLLRGASNTQSRGTSNAKTLKIQIYLDVLYGVAIFRLPQSSYTSAIDARNRDLDLAHARSRGQQSFSHGCMTQLDAGNLGAHIREMLSYGRNKKVNGRAKFLTLLSEMRRSVSASCGILDSCDKSVRE